jgi:anti-sigma-K factor RskA
MIDERQRELAGDFVLGVIEPAERAAFEAEMAQSPELAGLVETLRNRFASLDETAPALPVPDGLWDRIAGEIGGGRRPAAPPEPARTTTGAPRRDGRAWMKLAASVVVALGVGFLAGRSSVGTPPAPVVVAVLLDAAATPGAIVEAFANNRVHIVPLENFAVPPGKVLEVWTKPNEAIGPVSLGRFSTPREIDFAPAALPTPQAGQLYEITLEDAPGSPTGRPTGPILVKGLARLPML